MFIPHNYLKLLSLVFDYSGVTNEAARNDKLGFKEHSSLERHQEAYRHTLNLFVENLAQNHPKLLLEYASNFQRFINELQSPPFETRVNQSKGENIFWRYLYAPMIAALKKGNIVITTSNGEQSFEVSGGVVEVLKNKVMVLAE